MFKVTSHLAWKNFNFRHKEEGKRTNERPDILYACIFTILIFRGYFCASAFGQLAKSHSLQCVRSVHSLKSCWFICYSFCICALEHKRFRVLFLIPCCFVTEKSSLSSVTVQFTRPPLLEAERRGRLISQFYLFYKKEKSFLSQCSGLPPIFNGFFLGPWYTLPPC